MSGRNWIYPTPERSAFTKLLTVYSAAFAIALVAWVLNVGQLYWMAGALALLPVASRFLASMEQRDLRIEREAPLAGHQGEEVTARLKATSGSFLPKLHLTVEDLPPRGLTASPAGPLPLSLPPKGRDAVDYTLRLGRRGWHQLGEVLVSGTDPLGLVHQHSSRTLPARILVYPRVLPLGPQMLPPELGGGAAPVENAFVQGDGTSFFGIREYRPGDPLRHVHWRTAARLGRLTVVEWEAEQSRDTVIAIETASFAERDLGPGTTLDLAAGLAASLAAELMQQEHSVGLLVPGQGTADTLKSGPLSDLLEVLARMAPAPATSLSQELRNCASRLSPGVTVCWITSAGGGQILEDCRFMLAARFRPVLYALVEGARERGLPDNWRGVLKEVEGMGVRVIALYRDDELVRGLLN